MLDAVDKVKLRDEVAFLKKSLRLKHRMQEIPVVEMSVSNNVFIKKQILHFAQEPWFAFS